MRGLTGWPVQVESLKKGALGGLFFNAIHIAPTRRYVKPGANGGENAGIGGDWSASAAFPDSLRPMPARHQELRWIHRIRAILAVLIDHLLFSRWLSFKCACRALKIDAQGTEQFCKSMLDSSNNSHQVTW